VNVKFAYLGRSAMQGAGTVLNLSPNLARDPVAFDAPLLHPLRFREAISALHDVVTSDLRYKPRDKTAIKNGRRPSSSVRTRSAARSTSAPRPKSSRKRASRCRRAWSGISSGSGSSTGTNGRTIPIF